jgi:predicted acyltransferase (DUF342 family)
MVFIKLNRGSKLRQIKKQLAATLLCSTFALAAHAESINFDGAFDEHDNSKILGCQLQTTNVTSYLPAEGLDVTHTYTCGTGFTNNNNANIYIASGILVDMVTTGAGILESKTAILGAKGILVGNLSSTSTVALGANAEVEGDVDAETTVALGANALLTGNVTATTTIAVGADAKVIGDVDAGSTVALGANAEVQGNVDADSTVALGAGSSVTGYVMAGTTVALGAGSHVVGNVESLNSTVTLGVDSYVKGLTNAFSSATLGAGAYACKTITAGSAATLGTGSFVVGNLDAVTMTLAAGSFVTGSIIGTTATVGADGCYGVNAVINPLTKGAGAGVCGAINHPYNGIEGKSDVTKAKLFNCDPVTYADPSSVSTT